MFGQPNTLNLLTLHQLGFLGMNDKCVIFSELAYQGAETCVQEFAHLRVKRSLDV